MTTGAAAPRRVVGPARVLEVRVLVEDEEEPDVGEGAEAIRGVGRHALAELNVTSRRRRLCQGWKGSWPLLKLKRGMRRAATG